VRDFWTIAKDGIGYIIDLDLFDGKKTTGVNSLPCRKIVSKERILYVGQFMGQRCKKVVVLERS
jgi:hypothetical protein